MDNDMLKKLGISKEWVKSISADYCCWYFFLRESEKILDSHTNTERSKMLLPIILETAKPEHIKNYRLN